MKRFIWTFTAVIGIFSLASLSSAERTQAPGGTIRIGIVSTLFRDMPESLITAALQPFGALMESQTGITGEVVVGGEGLNLAQMLAEDKVQLGVFHGVEFSWAQQRYPELRPLMIAINQKRHLQAYLVLKADNPARDFGDLKGKTLALPKMSREHCHLFLKQNCSKLGKTPQTLFGRVINSANVEECLDDMIDNNQIDAAIVDNVALGCYERRKPARFKRLKLAQKSAIFPPSVVAYREGCIDKSTLEHFREGMVNANKNPIGRQMMGLWKLTAFDPVPPDLEENLQSIAKVYPSLK